MTRHIAEVTLGVPGYDEAIAFNGVAAVWQDSFGDKWALIQRGSR